MKIPRYGFFARLKDGFRGWRDGTRHRPAVYAAGDVQPAGHWNRINQWPGRLYTVIDDEAIRVSGDLMARLRQATHDVDLYQVEVTEFQLRLQKAHDDGADQHVEFKITNQLNGRRRKLLDALHAYEACESRARAMDRVVQVTKEKVYEHAKERFSVYIGRLVSHHRRGDLIQSAITSNYLTLGPIPPTQSAFATYTSPRESGPPPVRPSNGK